MELSISWKLCQKPAWMMNAVIDVEGGQSCYPMQEGDGRRSYAKLGKA